MSLYATLGETELEIITWLDGLSVRYGADYAEQGLIGRKSLLQYTGHRPDEVRIGARLHASWCNRRMRCAGSRSGWTTASRSLSCWAPASIAACL